MPRQTRIDIPGRLQHVIVSGVAQADIFLDDQHREDLDQRLSPPEELQAVTINLNQQSKVDLYVSRQLAGPESTDLDNS